MRVLDCRIAFPDEGHADNAYAHLVSLMEHAHAYARQVGAHMESSWARTHDCYVEDPEQECVTVALTKVGVQPDPGDGDYPAWQPYDGTEATIYQEGAEVSHNGKNWVSLINDNVWEPGVYGWQEIA